MMAVYVEIEGCSRSFSVTEEELEALEKAKNQGYLHYRYSIQLVNVYLVLCEKIRRPLVHIIPKRRFSNICVDLSPLEMCLPNTYEIRTRYAELIRKGSLTMLDSEIIYQIERAFMSGQCPCPHVYKVEKNNAPALAIELLAFVDKYKTKIVIEPCSTVYTKYVDKRTCK